MKIVNIKNNFLRKTVVVLATLIYVPLATPVAFLYGGLCYVVGAYLDLPSATRAAWKGR